MGKKGRPKKEEARTVQCKFWLTEKEEAELNTACLLTGKTRSEFMRKAMDAQIKLAKFQAGSM